MGNGMGTRVEYPKHPGAERESDAEGAPAGSPLAGGPYGSPSGAPTSLGRTVMGVATGSGLGGTVFWAVARRIHRKRKERRELETAPEPVTVVQLVPDRWAAALSDGGWKGPAAGLGALWLLLRLAELRRLKRLTRALTNAR